MIGIDLVAIQRISRILRERYSQSFIEKVFAPQELSAFLKPDDDKADLILSELFAIKESVIKASGQLLSIADFHKINVEWLQEGQYLVTVLGMSERFHVSTTLLGEQVMAIAVMRN